MTLLTALLGFIAAMILLLPWLRAPSCPTAPHTVQSGGGNDTQPARASIPKKVWAYWHSGIPPLVVQRCLASWRWLNPGYDVQLLGADNLFEFVERKDLPASFAGLTPARQSDWLRLYLLRRYGGIWLDASIILTRSLDWMLEQQQGSGAEFVGFYLDRYTQNPERPVIDSWCLAAPADSAFMREWYRELTDEALRLGDQAYLQRLLDEGHSPEILQGIASPDYMVIHVCAQRILHRNRGYRLCLLRAEDSAYFYQAKGRWKRPLLFLSVLIFKFPWRAPHLIKLRGGERRKLESYLRRGWYSRDSIAGRLLAAAANGKTRSL